MVSPLPRKPRIPSRLARRPSTRPAPQGPTGDAPLGFAVGNESNGGGTRALLEAHLVYARRRRERQEALVALGVSSVLPWIAMVWPHFLPSVVRTLAFGGWCALFVITVAACGLELRWYRRMVRRATALSEGGAGR